MRDVLAESLCHVYLIELRRNLYHFGTFNRGKSRILLRFYIFLQTFEKILFSRAIILTYFNVPYFFHQTTTYAV